MKLISFLLYISLSLIAGCTENDSSNNAGQQKQEHAWKEQTDTLEKARAVEGIMLDSAEGQQKQIQDITE